MDILNYEYVRELGVKFMKEKQNLSFLLLNALVIGFFGGLFFSLLHLGFHYFSITKVSHKQVLQFLKIDFPWIEKWYGYIFFIILISLLSIVLAVVYYLIAKRLKGWIYGAIYGLILWGIFGLLIPYVTNVTTFPQYLKTYTNVFYLCSFIIYGIFIGYSISYDYEMSKQRIQNG